MGKMPSGRMNEKLDLVFAALSDPTRRRILSMLLEGDLAVTEIARPFEMSVAAVSKHLRTLVRAGLVLQQKRGREVRCSIEPAALRDAFVWMESFGQFESSDLETIETYLAKSHPELLNQ